MKAKTIIKFIIFVAIFYALLAFNVFHLGEKIVPSSKDYLKESMPEDIGIEDEFFDNTALPPWSWHFAAAENKYEAMLNALCKSSNICNKVNFIGNHNTYDKYSYTKAIVILTDFIDANGEQQKEIKEVIKNIDIKKENGNRRGYATWDTIIINLGSVKSKKEFAELLTHEMGHIADLGYIQWSSSKKNRTYTEFGKAVFALNDPSLLFYKISRSNETIRKSEAKKKDFCSGYGMSDPFEDFSECFNLYLNHNILFREIAKNNTILKKKYNFIAALIDGKYMASKSSELNLIKENSTRRPRDTTKISN